MGKCLFHPIKTPFDSYRLGYKFISLSDNSLSCKMRAYQKHFLGYRKQVKLPTSYYLINYSEKCMTMTVQTEDKCSDEVRSLLLEYYSSKANNQTTIILGLAIAILTIVQIFNGLSVQLTLIRVGFALILDALVLFVIRAVFRLVLWNEFASAVISLKMLDKLTLNKILVSPPHDLTKIIESTDHLRLQLACQNYIEQEWKGVFSKVTSSKYSLMGLVLSELILSSLLYFLI
jgi:hypothetical protein